MTPKVKGLREVDHTVSAVGILLDIRNGKHRESGTSTYPFSQLLQDINLNKSLLMESLLVPNNLDRD
jgi:hypothetical protein